VERLFSLHSVRPLVESVCRNQTAATLERLFEGGLLRGSLGARIYHLVANARVLRPAGDQAPSHERSTANRLMRILPDDGHGLSWSDVVAGLPVHALVFCIEVAGQNLSAPRESVPSAHLLSIVAPDHLTQVPDTIPCRDRALLEMKLLFQP
jgi:hypothetical protein